MNRRITLAAIASITLASGAALAQSWPSRPVTMVVSYPAGGDTDAIARMYAEKLSARLGQQVLVDNRPGASGTIGNVAVAKAPADGYTLLFTPSTFPIAPYVLKKGTGASYDSVKDFTPISLTGSIPLLLVTSPNSGLKDMKNVLAEAKAGKPMTYASPGTGSPMHIAGEMLNQAAGVKLTHVPYRGVAPAVNDALGGHVSVAFVTPGAVAGHLIAGKLVPLAVAERQRSPLLPNVPTLIELGYPSLDVSAWMGLLGPKGMPAEIVRTLNGHMNEIVHMPDIVSRMAALGASPIGGEPALLAKQIEADEVRFSKIIKDFGIQAD